MAKLLSLKSRARAALRLALFPLVRYFGPRFHMLHLKLDRINHAFDTLFHRLDKFESHVGADLQTTVEFANTLQRTATILNDRIWRLDELIGSGHQGSGRLDPTIADRAAAQLVGTPLKDLGPGAAGFLNWAGGGGQSNFQVQAGVWFNPIVALHHSPGSVEAIFVNERIVEIPYALAAASALPQNGTVIDVGASESLLALMLATRGHKVLAVDPRGYPLSHPGLHPVRDPVHQWPGPTDPVDAVFCISTLEHLGLGAYDQQPADLDLDRFVMERFRTWLKPGGRLYLTTPYGKWSLSEFQRTYDDEHLEPLLKGWSVKERLVYFHESPFVWRPVDQGPASQSWDDGEEPGVILLTAVPEKE